MSLLPKTTIELSPPKAFAAASPFPHPTSLHSCGLLPFSTCLSPWLLQSGKSPLAKQTRYLSCFPSFCSLVPSLSALLWPIRYPQCQHFSSYSSSERKFCKIHQLGVCLPFTRLMGSTNGITAMKSRVWDLAWEQPQCSAGLGCPFPVQTRHLKRPVWKTTKCPVSSNQALQAEI